jgi:hypothetical protein
MSRFITRPAFFALLAAVAVGTSGCLATAVAGTAVGVTAAAVGTTAQVGAKVVGATARAVIPGGSKKDN